MPLLLYFCISINYVNHLCVLPCLYGNPPNPYVKLYPFSNKLDEGPSEEIW
ncbi:hypothetical protein OIU79_004486 [Salix purpurea]|uniref:Uncharacterized protein n=1 Tax=Salix purpurea TaxID=77065 RepID=A0A9Q0Z9N9_SALPP|nr:hypothetical protein OIU79_004486 [Salix purpurea]